MNKATASAPKGVWRQHFDLLPTPSDGTTITPEEERDLVQRARTGDQWAENKLVRIYSKLVLFTVKRFLKRTSWPGEVDQEDLFSRGLVGFTRGLHKFDVSKGYRLATYVTFWILHEVRLGAMEQGLIRIPHKVRRAIGHVEAVRNTVAKQNQFYTYEDIAEDLETTPEVVEDLLQIGKESSVFLVTFQDGIGDDGHSEWSVNGVRESVCPTPVSALPNQEEVCIAEERKGALLEALETLPEAQREAVRLKALEDENFEVIGERLGNKSRQYAHQCYKAGIQALKERLERKPGL